MAQKFKKIGVLTSGGDAPGMNAEIRAVVRKAKEYGIDVIGIDGGYKGLMDDKLIELDQRTVSNVIQKGGTMLHSIRCPEFASPEGMEKALDTLYTKTVPQGVREYIDMCAASPRTSPKPRRQRPAEPVSVSETTDPPTG